MSLLCTLIFFVGLKDRIRSLSNASALRIAKRGAGFIIYCEISGEKIQ